MTKPIRRTERIESVVQLTILVAIGSMAGAASFTHVHDWTMHNAPAGTGDWFGWANAVISELTPTAAGLDIRRRKRNGQHIGYPMTVLVLAAILSISAQLAVAKPGPTGWLLSAVPALAFLALSKLVLSRTPAAQVDSDAEQVPTIHVTAQRPAIEGEHPAPADIIPAHLLGGARMAAHNHRQTTGNPISADALADHLGIPQHLASTLLHHLHDEGDHGSRP